MNISNSTWSYEAFFWQAWVQHEPTWSCTRHGELFVTYSKSEASWTGMLLLLHIASWPNQHIESGFRRRHCEDSCIIGWFDREIVIFDIRSLRKVIIVPVLLLVRFFVILVTKFSDMIICLCMCKGRTHHAMDVESETGLKIANTFDFCLPIIAR
jgi:hypothetical protein